MNIPMRLLSSRLSLLVVLSIGIPGCGGLLVPEAPRQVPVEPFLHRPFTGEYPLTSIFDHDLPISWADSNGSVLAWWGDAVESLDGHMGYDWAMPEGTPLLAPAGGFVTRAGLGPASYCPPLGRATANRSVVILHDTPEGERFVTSLSHVSEVKVKVGDLVKSGQPVALSGNTGCSLGPHLHFQVEYQARWEAPTTSGALPVLGEGSVAVDPYGWAGSVPDPWAQHPLGAVSQYLWVEAAAPDPFQH